MPKPCSGDFKIVGKNNKQAIRKGTTHKVRFSQATKHNFTVFRLYICSGYILV